MSATITPMIRKGIEDMFADHGSREVDNVWGSDDEIRPLTATSLEPAAAAAEALTLRGFLRENPSAGWPPDSNAAQRHAAK